MERPARSARSSAPASGRFDAATTTSPSKEPGVYAFKTDLPMAGRYQITLSAKVQGEPETVSGKVIVKATK